MGVAYFRRKDELERLLADLGFTILANVCQDKVGENKYGEWFGEPPDEARLGYICVAQKGRGPDGNDDDDDADDVAD
jgi:hypothetical protein